MGCRGALSICAGNISFIESGIGIKVLSSVVSGEGLSP